MARLMNGEKAILFATDPPYLVGYDGTNHPGTKASEKRASLNTDWSGTYGKNWDEADAKQNVDLYDRFIRVAVEVATRVIGRLTTCDSDEHPYLRGYEVVVVAVLKNALRTEEYDYLTTEDAVRPPAASARTTEWRSA